MIENKNITDIKAHLQGFYNNGSIAGTWLFSGMKGLGKASAALQIAKMILGKTENDKIQVENKVHPDLLYIERGLTETEKKEVVKLLSAGQGLNPVEEAERKRSSEITVDDVRTINDFVHMSSATGWKVIIIDAADEMNTNAANAVLKVIEEPPKNTVVILVAHNERRLLPTILSRAKKIHFSPFTTDEIVKILTADNHPAMDAKQAAFIAEFSGGSVGKALLLAENNAATLFDDLLSLYTNFPRIDVVKAYKLADKVEKNEAYYETLKELYLTILVLLVKSKNGEGELSRYLPPKLTDRIDPKKVLELWGKTEHLFAEVTTKYLDKRQVLVNSFVELGLC